MPTQNVVTQRNVLLIVTPYLLGPGSAKNSKIRSFTAFPYGLLSVATYLKKQADGKVNVKVLDCNLFSDENYLQTIKRNLLDFKPDVVGLSMMFDTSYKHVKDISRVVKGNDNNTVLVLGGTAVGPSYSIIVNEQDDIDGLCFLDGEIPLLELLNSEDMVEFLENDLAWITKKSLKDGKPPTPSVVEDLSNIVDIDYSFVDVGKYGMKESFSPFITKKKAAKKQFFLVTSRGCPYKCVFCSNSSIHGKEMRYASVESVIEHVRYLVTNYGLEVLTIYDDQLLSNQKRAKEIFRQLTQFNLRVECPNGLSVAFIDDEMAALMKGAGMDTIALAIESGSEYMIKKVIHKPIRLETVKPVVLSLRKHGLFVEGYFVNGIPGEKEEHREETLDFIRDVELDWSGFSLVAPFRGSPLYDICIKNGYIDKDLGIGDVDLNKYIIKTPDLDPEQITKKTYFMNLEVNFVNNYRMKIGEYQVAARCFQDVIDRYPDQAFAYYFLAKAQEAMNESPDLVELNRNKYIEIIKDDVVWKEYAEYFSLEIYEKM